MSLLVGAPSDSSKGELPVSFKKWIIIRVLSIMKVLIDKLFDPYLFCVFLIENPFKLVLK